MDIFGIHQSITDEYRSYVQSFLTIADDRIRDLVEGQMQSPATICPDTLVQLNPWFARGLWESRGQDTPCTRTDTSCRLRRRPESGSRSRLGSGWLRNPASNVFCCLSVTVPRCVPESEATVI